MPRYKEHHFENSKKNYRLKEVIIIDRYESLEEQREKLLFTLLLNLDMDVI